MRNKPADVDQGLPRIDQGLYGFNLNGYAGGVNVSVDWIVIELCRARKSQ